MFKGSGKPELEVVQEDGGGSDSEDSQIANNENATTVGKVIKQSAQEYL